MIIDAHTHFAGEGRGRPPNSVEDLLCILDMNKIEALVTCAPYSSIGKDRTYDEANQFLAESMNKAPSRILPLVRVNPHLKENALESIQRFVGEKRFYGVKVHPRNEAFAINSEEIAYPIAKVTTKFQVPMLIHTGDPDTYGFAQPALVGDLADAFPNLTLIIGHMGKRLYEDAILVARWFDNIILETSFRSPREIAHAVRRIGADRVVYGSDMPFGIPEIEIMKIHLCDISPMEKDMILGGNIARILNLEGGR